MMDGWTEGTNHFLGVLITYMDSKGEYREVLLACRQLYDPEFLDAEEIIEFLDLTLASYNRKLSSVVALLADNCSTNARVSRLLHIPLIGCASHKMNLAVNNFIDENEEYSHVIDKVTTMMNELRGLKNSARLEKLTALKPIKPNKTRWSGNYKMCQRYKELEEYLELMPLPGRLYLTVPEKRVLSELTGHLKKFHDVTLRLQKREILPDQVRSVFNAMIEDY